MRGLGLTERVGGSDWRELEGMTVQRVWFEDLEGKLWHKSTVCCFGSVA